MIALALAEMVAVGSGLLPLPQPVTMNKHADTSVGTARRKSALG